MWDHTYASWITGEWYEIGSAVTMYPSVYWVVPDKIEVIFNETATEEMVASFISENQLEIISGALGQQLFTFTLLQEIHSVDFLKTQIDSEIIEYAQPDVEIPVGPA